jgi:hypothetical protein
MQKIGEHMQQGAPSPQAPSSEQGEQKPDIEEAEVEILDDDNKK